MIARDFEVPSDSGTDNVYNYTLNVADKLFFCGTGYQGFRVQMQIASLWARFCNVSKLIGLGGFCLLTAFAFFTAQSH